MLLNWASRCPMIRTLLFQRLVELKEKKEFWEEETEVLIRPISRQNKTYHTGTVDIKVGECRTLWEVGND